MKNLVKKALFVLTVLLGVTVTATNIENVEIKMLNSKMVDLSLKNYDGNLEISVVDSYGIVLYSQSFSGKNICKKYDLKSLPVGNYFFEVEGQTKIKVMPFTVSNVSIEFAKDAETVIYKPIIREVNDKIHVSKSSFTNNNVKLSVYDDYANEIYTADLTDKNVKGKILDVSQLVKGNYKIVVASGDRVFQKRIKI